MTKYIYSFIILIVLACNSNSTSETISTSNTTNTTSEKVVDYDKIDLSNLSPNKPQSFYIELMDHYLKNRNSEKITALWNFTKRHNLQIPELYVGYANFINENRTKNDEAIAIYKEAIALKPTYYLPYKIIGNIYIHYNMMQDALIYLTKAHEMQPTDIEVINNIANIYFVDHQYEIASSYYSKAIEIEPNEILYSNRAICYDQLGQPQLANQDRLKAQSYQKN